MKTTTNTAHADELKPSSRRSGLRRWKARVCALICLVGLATTLPAAVGPGTAPVNPPTGGFGIDGDLQANTNVALLVYTNIGDWVPGPAGSGGNVLTAAGAPLDTANTYYLTDPFNTNENNFAGGLKYFDDPSTWTWVVNPVPGKNDINHGLLHFTTDASGNLWVAVASDRRESNGDAFLDFEFLQNTLSITGTNGGGFTSAGPHGGRTVGDFLLTLSLSQGGSTAGFDVERWQTNAGVPLGFTYTNRTSLVPTGSVFAAVNTALVPVSFGAFGGTNYAINTFVEGAVNLTALLGAIDPCTSLGIKTMLIKCKTSTAPSSTITDFIAPLQIERRIGVADAGPDQTNCSAGASTTFTVTGVATPTPGDFVTNTTWSVSSGGATIDSPNSLTTAVHVTNAPATLRLTVMTKNGCTTFDEVVLNVIPPPACNITGDTNLFAASTGNPYSAPTGMVSYSWTVSTLSGTPNVTAYDTNSGALDSQSIKIDVASGGNGTISVALTIIDTNGCSSTCSNIVEIPGGPAGCISDLSFVCAGTTGVVYSVGAGQQVNATNYQWSVTGATFSQDHPTNGPNTQIDAGTGNYTVQVIISYQNGRTQTCTLPTLVTPLPACEITGPSPICPSSTGNIYSGPAGMDSYTWSISGNGTISETNGSQITVMAGATCGASFTLTLTVTNNGCTSTCSTNILVNDTIPPTVQTPGSGNGPQQCQSLAEFTAPTGTDNCDGNVTVTVIDTVTNGTPCLGSIVRRWRLADDCGNAMTNSATVVIEDTTAPTVQTPGSGNGPQQCQSGAEFTAPTGTDNCGGNVTVTLIDTVTNGPPCLGSIVRRWRLADDCGNAMTNSATVVIEDTTAPSISCQNIVGNTDGGLCSKSNVTYNVTTDDNCGGTVTVVCIPPSGSTFPKGTNSVNCTATDACGKSNSCSFTVTINDPGFNCLPCFGFIKQADRTTAPIGGTIIYTYTVINCGGTALTNVTVVDDNGTPSLPGDDVVVGTVTNLPPGTSTNLTYTAILPITVCGNGSPSGLLIPQVLSNGNVRVVFIQATNINDNTYGANAMGWQEPRGHSLKDLLNSDHAVFQFRNGAGQIVMQFAQDYITASTPNATYPSGYRTLGVTGGDGAMVIGSAANVVFVSSSLTENLNKQPFLSNLSNYTNNSPALSDPNSSSWEYRMTYTVVVSNAAFGPSGFGSVAILDQHNSPQKTAVFTPTPCDACVTNIAVLTARSGPNTVTTNASFVVCTAPCPASGPTLSIQRQGSGLVKICWTTACPGFVLEETTSLNPVIQWSPVNAVVSIEGETYCVTLPSNQQQRFYRLRAP